MFILVLAHPSLVPRPPPRFYLAAVEKIWAEAWERGYRLTLTGCYKYVIFISSNSPVQLYDLSSTHVYL